MTAGEPRTIADLDVSVEVLTAAMAATHSESDRIAYALDVYLVQHPEATPYPNTCNPADFAASVAAGYVEPAYPADCEPAFTPRRTKTTDVETGGRL